MFSFLKDNWFKVVIVLVIIIGWFYWFELRPGNIRHNCLKRVFDLEEVEENQNSVRLNNNYRACLIKYKLKPESVFVNIK